MTDPVAEILAKIPGIPWFTAAGCTDGRAECERSISDYLTVIARQANATVRWLSGWEEARRLARGMDESSSLWTLHERRRQEALKRVTELGKRQQLEDALDELILLCYENHVRPGLADEELARAAAGAAQWTAGEAVTWAVAADRLEGPNPFLGKLRAFELGHWPLGLADGRFVVL